MAGRKAIIALLVFMLTAFWVIGGPAAAVEEKDKPARGIIAAMRYPGIAVGPEGKVRVDLVLINTGRSSETVLLEVTEKPEGWKTDFKSYGDVVSGIFLAEDETKNITFSADPEDPDKKPAPGQYTFKIKVSTPDGVLVQNTSVDVTVTAKEKVTDAIKLDTSYPVLRGPSDARFEFSIDVKNDSDADALFNLSATAPEGWEVSFSPAYEQKQISSLQIQANQSKSVSVGVKPGPKAEAGTYPIKVSVATAAAKSEVDLQVMLTGTYALKTGTLDGLLSLSTEKGQESSISLYVRNEGTAPQGEISFLSFKPENWTVEFAPEKIDGLKPGELKQVEVKIKPAEEALVGDYSVAVSVQGEKATDEVELRVTVNASSAWGWIGVGIIVLTIIGLAVIFKVLGRR